MAESTGREILSDAFTRLIEHVDSITDDLSDDVSFFRPTREYDGVQHGLTRRGAHRISNGSLCWKRLDGR